MSAGVQTYPQVPQLAAGLMDIPSSMLSDSQPRLIASQVRQVQLPSQSGDQQPSGVMNFQISTGVGQGYLKRGSCFLRTTLVLTNAAFAADQAAPMPLDEAANAAKPAFGGPLAMASQIINRLTLLSGGSVIEQINNYHVVASVINSHASNKPYITGDAGIYENALQHFCVGTVDTYGADRASCTITVTIPLLSGLLQGNHHVPLFLLSGNLQLQLDLNPLNVSFTNGVTTCSFTQNTLMYEQLSVDAVLEATLKQSLMRAPFQIPFNSFVSLAAAVAGPNTTVSQPIGLNLSSVYGVLFTEILTPNNRDDRKALVKNGASALRLFADGRLVNSYRIDKDPLFFVEMNKVFNLAFDANRTSIIGSTPDLIATAANQASRLVYSNYIFAGGVCMTRVAEEGVVMAGSPVNQALIEVEHNGGNAGGSTAYYIVPHQLIFTVDVAGTAAVIR